MLLAISSSAYLILLPLAPLILASTSSKCYYPDGTYQPRDFPCFPDQADSFCCAQGHSCMSNGLCRWPDAQMPAPMAYIRGSCTDESWRSGACPQHCGNVHSSEWDVIIGCSKNEFCCSPSNNANNACCTANTTAPEPTASASLTIFKLDTATTVTVIGQSGYAAVSLSSSDLQSSTANNPPTQTTTATATATATASARTSGSGTNIGMGIGMGVCVFVLALTLCGWVF